MRSIGRRSSTHVEVSASNIRCNSRTDLFCMVQFSAILRRVNGTIFSHSLFPAMVNAVHHIHAAIRHHVRSHIVHGGLFTILSSRHRERAFGSLHNGRSVCIFDRLYAINGLISVLTSKRRFVLCAICACRNNTLRPIRIGFRFCNRMIRTYRHCLSVITSDIIAFVSVHIRCHRASFSFCQTNHRAAGRNIVSGSVHRGICRSNFRSIIVEFVHFCAVTGTQSVNSTMISFELGICHIAVRYAHGCILCGFTIDSRSCKLHSICHGGASFIKLRYLPLFVSVGISRFLHGESRSCAFILERSFRSVFRYSNAFFVSNSFCATGANCIILHGCQSAIGLSNSCRQIPILVHIHSDNLAVIAQDIRIRFIHLGRSHILQRILIYATHIHAGCSTIGRRHICKILCIFHMVLHLLQTTIFKNVVCCFGFRTGRSVLHTHSHWIIARFKFITIGVCHLSKIILAGIIPILVNTECAELRIGDSCIPVRIPAGSRDTSCLRLRCRSVSGNLESGAGNTAICILRCCHASDTSVFIKRIVQLDIPIFGSRTKIFIIAIRKHVFGRLFSKR